MNTSNPAATQMVERYDVLIIGGGPAGLTAGIYASRAGLNAAVLDKGICGGMAATSPLIENYPAFKAVSGWDLMERMRGQAEEILTLVTGAEIIKTERSEQGFIIETADKQFSSTSVVLATGAEYRLLGVPGEMELFGKGVSYCATCDGAFFRGKKVVVVGGGNNGATEALHLKHTGCDVSLIHRRDILRAEQYLQDRMAEEGIGLILSSTVEKILGESKVESVELKSCTDGTTSQLPVDGVFISVGVVPSTDLARQLGVGLEDDGYITVDRSLRTNVRMVYAAGDVTGGLRQIVTACAEGATAAMSAYEDIKTPYWIR